MDGFEIHDRRFATYVLANAPLETLAEGFRWIEGPVWMGDADCLLFQDLPRNRTMRWSEATGLSVYRAPSDYANGQTRDRQGRLVACSHHGRCLYRTELDGHVTTLVSRHDGKRLNAPNDVICRSNGSIYFTDPTFRMPFSEREVESNGVYCVTPDGAISLIAEAELPNGLAFSPDERTLYLANTRATHYVLAFDLNDDGLPVRRRIFADMSSDEQGGAPDGMKVDAEGHVYCTGAGGTWVFEPSGKAARNRASVVFAGTVRTSARIIRRTVRSRSQPTSAALRMVSPRRWKRQVANE